jgi:hypothetical protein
MFSVTVKLDVYVKTEEILLELVKALQLSKLPETNLKVLVDKVDISCLGEARVMMLMDQLNEEVSKVVNSTKVLAFQNGRIKLMKFM